MTSHLVPTPPPLAGARARAVRGLGVVLATLLAGLFALTACGSTSKERIEAEVRVLGKNAVLAELPILELPLPATQEDGERVLRYVHLPAEQPSGHAPLVLVHGTPDTLFTWSKLLAPEHGLNRDRDVYALEVIGHGIAPEHDGDITFARCARFVADAVAALDVGPVHLAGNSYGGEFVWRAALLAPERIASVILMDSSGPPRPEGGFLPEEQAMRDHPLANIGYLLNSRERIRRALDPQYEEPAEADEVEEMFWVCDNRANWLAMVDLAQDENGEAFPELANLTRPVLLLWGANDLAYPPADYARRFLDILPDARLEVLPDCGHYPHEERPAETARRLLAFLESLSATD